MIIPAFYKLMGSQHPGYHGKQGASWQMPDTANSSAILPFYFHGGMMQSWWTTWTIIWRPGVNGTSKSRHIAMDTGGPGYGNWETLVNFDGPANKGPIVTAIELTGKWNQMVDAMISKYIGFQMLDDGLNEYTLWEARLEVNWLLPSAKPAFFAALEERKAARPPISKVVHAEIGDLAALPQPPKMPA